MGPRGSAAETAFANCLTNNKDGFTSLLAVVAPNLMCKPATVMFNKVTIKGAKQAVQMFGPAQHAVAKAVADSVAEGVDPGGRGRRPVHLRRRVHPLGSGRRQEDPGVQLPGHEGIDRARGLGLRRRPPRSSRSATTSSIRSPLRAETAARRRSLRRKPKASFAGWVGCSGCHDGGEQACSPHRSPRDSYDPASRLACWTAFMHCAS